MREMLETLSAVGKLIGGTFSGRGYFVCDRFETVLTPFHEACGTVLIGNFQSDLMAAERAAYC